MSEFFGSVWWLLVTLGLLVTFHEFGHYWVARRCGVKVLRFSIGVGKPIWSRMGRDGVEYAIGAIPLGGYVKFHGDVNGASMPDPEAVARMSPQERAISFPTQPVSKRAAIVAAGPVANFILAILLFAGAIWLGGRYELPARVSSVEPNSVAAQAGLRSQSPWLRYTSPEVVHSVRNRSATRAIAPAICGSTGNPSVA